MGGITRAARRPAVEAALPGPRSGASSRTTRPFVGVAFAILIALLLQQRGSIEELQDRARTAAETAGGTSERLAAIAEMQASLERRVDDLFDPATIVRSARPSVYTLIAGAAQGSSFVLASDGDSSLLVTNYHVVRRGVVAGAPEVVVRGAGRSMNGTVVGSWPGADLAVIEVRTTLPVLEANLAVPDVGDPVVALGSPFGLAGTVTTGVVSAIRTRYVQFSASVGPGSSGGPLLDGHGRVIGVGTAKVTSRGAEGLSFAIPIELVCRLTAACGEEAGR